MTRSLFFSLLFFLLILAGQSYGLEKKVVLATQWSAQAQFSGFYMAKERGFYKAGGLDVTILDGGPELQKAENQAREKADFVIMQLSSAIVMYDQGQKMINIAQMLQHSGLMFIAKKKRGIRSIKDLQGKTVGLWKGDGQREPLMLLDSQNIRVNAIPQSGTINLFLCDGLDAVSGTLYNEYHTILLAGYNPDEIVTIPLRETGMDFPQDGIYVKEEFFRQNPDTCRAFVQASLQGWDYAFEHPVQAVETTKNRMLREHLPANVPHQRWMLDRIKDLMAFGDTTVRQGTLSRDSYQRLTAALKEKNKIRQIPPFERFHRFCGE